MKIINKITKTHHSCRYLFLFYTPVFRRDVLWYGNVRPRLRQSVFRTFHLHALIYQAGILHLTLF